MGTTIIIWLKSFWNWLKGLFTKAERKEAPAPTPNIDEQLVFKPSEHLTLGVEMELSVLDRATHRIAHEAQFAIDTLQSPHVHQEGAEHILEITTGVCRNVNEAETQLRELAKNAAALLEDRNAVLSGTGRPALYHNHEARLVRSPRYDDLNQRVQSLYRNFCRMQGMHVHIGMRSAEECIRNHNFFVHFLPHILALSASTPVENEVDTGLASLRAAMLESLPIAGLPYHFSNWHEYQSLCLAMETAGSIRSLKDLWSDLRPCPRYGTLEIRIADQPATMAESMAIVAFIHGLAQWFEEHYNWLDEMHRPSGWRMRDNKWRAMRYGLDGELIVNNQGDTRGMKEEILNWINRLEPYMTRNRYGPHMKVLRDMVLRGNSAQRQRRVLAATNGDMAALSDFNRREWQNGAPLWDELEQFEGGGVGETDMDNVVELRRPA